ncbi:MAG: response regulator [Bryobacteraceae bacterium]|nr:response regulator [Bryobacteraceae bacterium]MDW8376791.1 response regulator [Bryobacterales bacterium]
MALLGNDPHAQPSSSVAQEPVSGPISGALDPMPATSGSQLAASANSVRSDSNTVSKIGPAFEMLGRSPASVGLASSRKEINPLGVETGPVQAHGTSNNNSARIEATPTPPVVQTPPFDGWQAAAGGSSSEDLSSLKGRFLAVLNHEIRTPLSGIMGMTDLLMETKLDDEQREYVAATRACAETLFEVLNATLEYSALSTGRVDLESSEFHVHEVVHAAIAEHQFRAESKGLRLYATFEKGVPETLLGDALRLRQLLSHLISNGVKFTPSGEVEVRLWPVSFTDHEVRLCFQVRDTGIGIAQEQLAHIFDSFRQIDSGLARNYSGLGLGLAIVEKLAALMKGSLRAESTVGQGSSFFVECSFQRSEEYHNTSTSETAQSQAAEATILLVEDNDVAQRIYTHVLSRGNYHVECVSSGPEAVRLAQRRKFDLILMDLQMPGVDGIQAARSIRALAGYEETPILALTANSAEDHRRLCLENGMQGFLTKPIPSEELLASIRSYLRQG